MMLFSKTWPFWGSHTVYRFACSYNPKAPRFNSRFFQTGCKAVVEFSQDWRHENNWICPPACLSIRVVKHMELCKPGETVILPSRKSSRFWTVFCSDGVHWNSFVFDWVYLPKFPGLFIRGKARNSLFRSLPLDFDITAFQFISIFPHLPLLTPFSLLLITMFMIHAFPTHINPRTKKL